MAKRYGSDEIINLKNRSFFFDANVLLYIYWPTGRGSNWERQYSAIFSRLLKQSSNMFVDFNVISEIVNRAIRTEYEKHLQQHNILRSNLPLKNYRDSQEGQESIDDIYQIVKSKILYKFLITGKAFSKSEIESFLCDDSLDFIDKGISAICKENNFILLTNDKDFANSNLEILSANPALRR